jgi:hypothetical protein
VISIVPMETMIWKRLLKLWFKVEFPKARTFKNITVSSAHSKLNNEKCLYYIFENYFLNKKVFNG